MVRLSRLGADDVTVYLTCSQLRARAHLSADGRASRELLVVPVKVGGVVRDGDRAGACTVYITCMTCQYKLFAEVNYT